MKTVRKTLVLAACAILLVCATVVGTLAYLTATATVQNTFTVGNVSITMDETDVDNSTPNMDRDTENKYKLLPGQAYTKDPVIHVDTESEDCYVFVKVTNNISEVEAEDNTIVSQMEKNGWMLVPGTSNVYYQPNAVKGGTNVPVFANFTVRSDADADDLNKVAGQTIVVEAYAVQAAGFKADEDGTPAAVVAWNTTFGAAGAQG